MSNKQAIVAAGMVAVLLGGGLMVLDSPTPLPTPQVAVSAPQHPAVVLLEMPGGGRGSGVVIAPDWVLTCLHCGDANKAGGLSVHRLIPMPGAPDMALMYVPGLRADHYVPLASEAARLHDPVSAYGYHLGRQFQKTDGYQGTEPEQMSAPIIHGCSGGAVVNADGELLGVITWVAYTGTYYGRDGYALPHMSGYTPITGDLRAFILKTLSE